MTTNSEWRDIESAPKDGTPIQAKIPGHGSDNIIAWTDDCLLDSAGDFCGAWVFTTEQEPPECWTDGYCWEVNEWGQRSAHPTEWTQPPEKSA